MLAGWLALMAKAEETFGVVVTKAKGVKRHLKAFLNVSVESNQDTEECMQMNSSYMDDK